MPSLPVRRTARDWVACVAVLAVAFGAPTQPAAADPVTPAQAKSLEAQMQAWLVDAIGSAVTLPKRPVQVSAAGDHYELAVPFAVLLGSAGAPAAGSGMVTASLKPLDQGKWALDDVAAPSPAHFAFDMGSAGRKMPVEVDMKFADQNTHILFDQNFATASTMTSTVGAFDLHVTGVKQEQTQHIEGTTAHAAITPATAGRVDVTEDVKARGVSLRAHSSDDHVIRLDAEHLSLAAHLDEVDRLKVLAALQAITRMSGSLATALAPPEAAAAKPRAGGGPPAKQPNLADAAARALDRAAVRNMIITLRDIASGGEVDEVMDGLKVSYDGHAGAAEHVTIGIGAAAPQGMLEAHLEMGIDGIAIADVPMTMAAYLPQHIKLRPFVAGISMADLTRMALDATGPDAGRVPDPAPLFSHGGITFGLERLVLDLGGTAFVGTAKLVATSPEHVSGQAQLTATNFDGLMRMVQNDPMLSGGFPVMVMLRGLGRSSGNQTVWDIAVEDSSISVNGTDLTAMFGGSKK